MASSGAWILRICLRFTHILIPLLLLSGVALGLERAFFFHRTRLRPDVLLGGLKNLMADGRFGEALRLCEQTPGALARVLKRLLLVRDGSPRRMEEEYLRQAQWELQTLERHMGSIALLAKLLPLVGCLATLLALMANFFPPNQLHSYVSLEAFTPNCLDAFAAAIAATAAAIAMNLCYHFLHGRLSNCVREIYAGARELYCEWLSIRGEDAP
jgi:biopolymer transport protein ExbB/TolQ